MSARKAFLRGLRREPVLLITFAVAVGSAPAQTLDATMQPDMHWRMIGPFRGGRTVAVTGVPNAP